jgi:hypothetical protein
VVGRQVRKDPLLPTARTLAAVPERGPQTMALVPVMARPTMSVLTSRVPS